MTCCFRVASRLIAGSYRVYVRSSSKSSKDSLGFLKLSVCAWAQTRIMASGGGICRKCPKGPSAVIQNHSDIIQSFCTVILDASLTRSCVTLILNGFLCVVEMPKQASQSSMSIDVPLFNGERVTSRDAKWPSVQHVHRRSSF